MKFFMNFVVENNVFFGRVIIFQGYAETKKF